MADDTVKIEVKTSADTSGLDDTNKTLDETKKKTEELNHATQAAADVAMDQIQQEKLAAQEAEKRAAAQERAAKKAEAAAHKEARGWRAIGGSVRSLASGDIPGAVSALSGLSASFAAVGGAAMMAIGPWVTFFKELYKQIKDNARAVDEIKFGNAESNAKALAERYEEVAKRLDEIKSRADSLASATEAVADAESSARIAEINARRKQALAEVVGDQAAEKRVNADFDMQVADAQNSREQDRVAEAKARQVRERQHIQAQLAQLDAREADLTAQNEEAGRHAGTNMDKYNLWGGNQGWLPNFGASFFTLGWTGRKAASALNDANRWRGIQQGALAGLGDVETRRQSLRAELAQLDAQGALPDIQARTAESNHAAAAAGAQTMRRQAADIEAAQAQKRMDAEKAALDKLAAFNDKTTALQTGAAISQELLEKTRGARYETAAQLNEAELGYRAAPTTGGASRVVELRKALAEMDKNIKEYDDAVVKGLERISAHLKTRTADMGGD